MNPNFIEWLEKQDYDWSLEYNEIHRIKGEGRIWMVKKVYESYIDRNSAMTYAWESVLNNYLAIKIVEHESRI
jgi:hypothetical protein